MAQARSHDTSTAPTDPPDGTETPAPTTDAYTTTPGQSLPKDGNGHWGVAARWFVFAMLAVAFIVSLYVFF